MTTIKHLRDFNRLKKRYTGFYVDVDLKNGNGSNLAGVIAPKEIELELLGYLGLSELDGNYMFVITPDNTASYVCASIVKRITVNTSRLCAILPN